MLVSKITCIFSRLCSQSFGLGLGLFTKSRNNTLYQSRENWFLWKKLIAGGKYFSWGKFAEGKTPNIGTTFLAKKKKTLFIMTGFIPLTAVHYFDNSYVGKQPAAWKEYCAKYQLK